MTDNLSPLMEGLWQLLPWLGMALLLPLLIWGVGRLLFDRFSFFADHPKLRQLTLMALTLGGLVTGILLLPVNDETRGQLLSLLGLLLTAIIAMSSTTLASNAMAGLMIRAMRNIHTGDYVRSGEHFGRVTEIGLFHTEIQTSRRDLTALPNAFIVSHPITVVRNSGTIVDATVSIGYDVPHDTIEPLLLQAAATAKLDDAFVLILELGNYAINYRIAGFLEETRHLVSTASHLRRAVLDTLHHAGIEIASPTLMMQRPLAAGQRLVPQQAATSPRPSQQDADAPRPEDLVFDKAELAAQVDRLGFERQDLSESLKALEQQRSKTDTDNTTECTRLDGEIAALKAQLDDIDSFLAREE